MKKNIKFRIRATSIWPFNSNEQGSEDSYITNEKNDHNQNCGENFVAELPHIVETIQQITIEDLPTNMSKNDQHYYVNMPQSLIVIKKQQ